MKTKVIRIDPARIRLLELNARFMRHETFMRLVENIARDGEITQIPFGWHMHDDETGEPLFDDSGEPIYEVLSGNHRVKAAVAANLPEIDFQAAEGYLPPEQRKAIQLSHNAITGEDDPATLKLIYESIDDTDMKMYSGLDDKALDLLHAVDIQSISEANLLFQRAAFFFLPDELEQVNEVWEVAKREAAGCDALWFAPMSTYDAALDALELASHSSGIKNVATALMLVLEIFTRHLDDLKEMYLDDEGNATEPKRWVPIATMLGYSVPAGVLEKMNRVIARLKSNKVITEDWQALEHVLDAYLTDAT